MTTTTANAVHADLLATAAAAGSPATRSTRPARTRPSTCSGCSTTASCGSTPDRRRRPRPRPLPALQGARAGRVLRRTRRQGLHPATPGWTTSPARTAGSVTTRTGCWCPGVEIGSGSLGHGLGLGVGTALGLRAQGLTRPAGVRPARRRRTGRGLQPRGDRVRGRDRPGHAHRDRDRQPVGHARLAGRDRRRFTVNGWTAATVDGRDHDAIDAGAARTTTGTGRTSSSPASRTKG